jgi:hypothetical protein
VVVSVLTVLAHQDHGWLWFWPLVPLFWLLLLPTFRSDLVAAGVSTSGNYKREEAAKWQTSS